MREPAGGMGEEFREPDAFAAPIPSDGVEAVTPVASTYEQQRVFAKSAAQYALKRARRVFKHAFAPAAGTAAS